MRDTVHQILSLEASDAFQFKYRTSFHVRLADGCATAGRETLPEFQKDFVRQGLSLLGVGQREIPNHEFRPPARALADLLVSRFCNVKAIPCSRTRRARLNTFLLAGIPASN